MSDASLHRQPAYRIYRTSRLLRAHLLEVLADAGLTPEQYFILQRLHSHGSPQGELGDPVLDDRATVSRQVASLERRGLITRCTDPDDARALRVALTAEGEALVRALRPRVAAARADLFGAVSAVELEAFHHVLDLVDAALG